MPVFLGIALLLHESVYLSSRGFKHFVDDLAPAFGLHLKEYQRISLHVLFVTTIVACFLYPNSRYSMLALLLLLSVLIAAFPKRVPNHLAVAWFFLLAICLDRFVASADHLSRGAIQLFTAATYMFAAFHKLNHHFFNPQKSCGSGLILHYLLQRGVGLTKQPKWVVLIGTFAIVAVEFICSILLVNNSTTRIGVLLIALLALSFGYLGHAHFSVVMLAGLATFLEQPIDLPGTQIVFILYLFISVVLTLIGGNTQAYRYPYLTFLNYTILSFATIMLIHQLFVGASSSKAIALAFKSEPLLLIALLVAFSLNAVAPYLGIKFDFSLAMFSNLRPDEWDHLIIRRPIRLGAPRYVAKIILNCEPAYNSKASQLFSALCPYPDSDRYTIGYLAETVSYMCKMIGKEAKVSFAGQEVSSGRTVFIGGDKSEVLKWYEKLCIYPFRIPGPDEPLCA